MQIIMIQQHRDEVNLIPGRVRRLIYDMECSSCKDISRYPVVPKVKRPICKMLISPLLDRNPGSSFHFSFPVRLVERE